MSIKFTINSLIIGITFFFTSCKDAVKVETFNITIVFAQDLHLEKGAPLDDYMKNIINYKIVDSCQSNLFIPNVTIVREDLPAKDHELVPIPLSWLNSWRPLSWVPAKNLRDDFDKNINDLKNPNIICAKSDTIIQEKLLLDKYPNAILIDFNGDVTLKIKEAFLINILPSLCNSESRDFYFIFYKKEQENPIDTTETPITRPPTPRPPTPRPNPPDQSDQLTAESIAKETELYEHKMQDIRSMIALLPEGLKKKQSEQQLLSINRLFEDAKSKNEKLSEVTILLIDRLNSELKKQ